MHALLLQVSALAAQLSDMASENEQLEDRATGLGWCLQRFQATYAALMKVSIYLDGQLLQQFQAVV